MTVVGSRVWDWVMCSSLCRGLSQSRDVLGKIATVFLDADVRGRERRIEVDVDAQLPQLLAHDEVLTHEPTIHHAHVEDPAAHPPFVLVFLARIPEQLQRSTREPDEPR